MGRGLGGLLRWPRACGRAPADDLVLWGTPARGQRLVRELRAFAALQASQRKAPRAEPGADLEIAGHVLSAETLAAISAVDLTEHPLPAPEGRNVLLLERDGLAADAALVEHLRDVGAAMRLGAGPGWGRMTAE